MAIRTVLVGMVVCGLGAGMTPRLAGASEQPVEGRKLVMKRSASGKEKAVFLSKDTALVGPTASGADDPTVVGATIDFCSNAGAASFTMPAGNWKANGPGTVFKFVNKGAPEPPSSVKVALIKGGRTLKVVSKEAGLPLLGAEGQVGVRVTMGPTSNCALFSSDVVQKDLEGKLIAKMSSVAGVSDCSDATLGCSSSPSGAFLE